MSSSLLRIARSARAFARAPGLSFALLLTIALGVGSNAAVFGFLQGLTHPASPLAGSGRIISIFGQDRYRQNGPLSPGDYQLLNHVPGIFDWTGAARINPADTLIDGHHEIVTVAAVTPSLATGLAVPATGIEISHRLAQSDFGSQNAIGSAIRIENADLRIERLAPDQLEGLYSDQNVDLWKQASPPDLESGGRDRRDLWVIARLRDGVSIPQAQTALRSASSSLADVSIIPFTGIAPRMARGLTRVGLFLNFSAAAVFFIACINVASFLLGRALRRSHETSLRIALGATRAELLRNLLSDSVVLAIAGGAMGILLGILTARALPAFLFEQDAARLTFAPHILPILAASSVCIVITVLCGMLPVLGTVTDRPWTVLQRETGSPSRAVLRLRSALVVGQMTACCMLVLGTTLLIAGLHAALKTSAGHRLGNPILLTVTPPRPDGPEADTNYFPEVERAAKTVPGLAPLAWTARLPGGQATWQSFRVQRFSPGERTVALDIDWLTPGSLQSFRSEPVAGRMFGVIDQRYRVAVVDEAAAAAIFGLQTAGAVIRDADNQPVEIIGVLRRKSSDPRQPGRPTIYYGYTDQPPHPIHDARFHVPLEAPAAGIELSTNMVSANYFGALGMSLLAGQPFPPDSLSSQERTAVVNQEAADLYFHSKPLGAAVIDDNGVRTEIIGVVQSQVFGTFEQHAEPAIYFPIGPGCPSRMTLLLRNSQGSNAIAAQLRRTILNVPGTNPRGIAINTLDAQLSQSGLAPLRIATLIGTVTAAMGLLLSILGLISAQSDAERQRQRDRALRLALGAQRWRIVLIVMANAGRLAFMGTATGTLLSFALLRLLIADITAVSSPPFRVWLIAPLVPVAAVLIASMLPARRSSATSALSIMRDN